MAPKFRVRAILNLDRLPNLTRLALALSNAKASNIYEKYWLIMLSFFGCTRQCQKKCVRLNSQSCQIGQNCWPARSFTFSCASFAVVQFLKIHKKWKYKKLRGCYGSASMQPGRKRYIRSTLPFSFRSASHMYSFFSWIFCWPIWHTLLVALSL